MLHVKSRMKKRIFVLVLIFSISSAIAQKNCEKCNIQKIKAVYENIDNLTYKIVDEFLCAFDKSCDANVEFSQWSNEMLFNVIKNSAHLYFEVLKNLSEEKKTLLLKEIETPIQEMDLNKVSDKIKSVNISKELKNKYLTALKNQ